MSGRTMRAEPDPDLERAIREAHGLTEESRQELLTALHEWLAGIHQQQRGLARLVRNVITAETAPRAVAPAASGSEPLYVSVVEAAKLCALGKTEAYELVASGDWPSRRQGRRILVDYHGLCAWRARSMQRAVPEAVVRLSERGGMV